MKTLARRYGVATGDGAELVPEPRGHAAEYQLLYKYLRDRYANRVVLTFGEIEDLLGFALPSTARVQPEWWGAAPRSSPQAFAWTLAGRTAAVNLASQSVVFDRETPAAAPSRLNKAVHRA